MREDRNHDGQPKDRHPILWVKFSVLFIVALFGLSNLPVIFNGDQALFVVYAEEINKGALLYRDVWDIKQPGIFIFYLVGGKLFGFNETGIHLFELIYWLAFSVVLQSTLKNYFGNPLFAQLTPLLTVGVYYAVCRDWHLTQVEGLIGFPLYLTLWATIKAVSGGSMRRQIGLSFLAGFFGGLVLIFKAVFLPLLLLFWLVPLGSTIRNKKSTLRKIGGIFVLPLLAGLTVLPAIVFIYFAWHDALPVVFYTFFQYPSQAVLELTTPDRYEVLRSGILWFVLNFKSSILLLLIGIFFKLVFRGKQEIPGFYAAADAESRLINAGLFIWLVVGFGIILFQRLSWWEYHYLLLFVPLGILSAKGLEIVWVGATNLDRFFYKTATKIAFWGLMALLSFPHLKQVVLKAKDGFEDHLKVSKNQPFSPRNDFAEKYLAIRDEVGFLSEREAAGEKIFVFGQPLYYYHSKRAPAISSNGWMPEFFLARQWRQLEAELRSRQPKPRFIFIEVNLYDQLAAGSPETIRLLQDSYRLRGQNRYAYCYELYPES